MQNQKCKIKSAEWKVQNGKWKTKVQKKSAKRKCGTPIFYLTNQLNVSKCKFNVPTDQNLWRISLINEHLETTHVASLNLSKCGHITLH